MSLIVTNKVEIVCLRFAVDGLKFIIGELGIGEGGKRRK